MLKKILIVAIALILIVPLCFASNTDNSTTPPPASQTDSGKKVLGIFLKAPDTYLNNENAKNNVQKKVAKLFTPDIFVVLPMDTILSESAIYRENNEMTPDQPLAKKDIQKIAAGLNCDYILLINMANTPSRIEIEFPSVSSISDVTCDIGLFNVNTGNYLVAVEVINKGKREHTVDRDALFEKAYDETLNKALKALEIDVKTL